jgi:TRAP-type C4-dicarboxylate transport system permease small subunit
VRPESPAVAGSIAPIRRSASVLAGLATIAMTLLGTADVAGRFFLDRPLLGQVEIARILLVYAAFLGLAEAELVGAHVRLGALDSLLPPRALAWRDCAVALVASLVALLVTSASAIDFWDSWRIGETMMAPIMLPAWLAKLGVVIGFVLLTGGLASGLLRRASAWSR